MLFVLDLDDTLYLERDYVLSGFIAVDRWLSEHIGLNCFYENASRLFQSGARGNIFDLVMKQFNLFSVDLVQALVGIYRHHLPEINLMPDAHDFLQLHGPESLALISDGHSEAQWSKIQALGIERKVGKIIVTGDRGETFCKPHPWSYLITQGNLPAESCVYIGDNPLKDFQAPHTLGWKPSFRIRRKESLHFDLPTPEYCIEIGSFAEL